MLTNALTMQCGHTASAKSADHKVVINKELGSGGGCESFMISCHVQAAVSVELGAARADADVISTIGP